MIHISLRFCPFTFQYRRQTEGYEGRGFSVWQLVMRNDEVCNGLLMVLLMNGCGDYERVEGLKIQIGHRHPAIAQFGVVLALANIRCRPLGNFSRLPFGGSVNNQVIHDVTRIVTDTTRSR